MVKTTMDFERGGYVVMYTWKNYLLLIYINQYINPTFIFFLDRAQLSIIG